MNNGLTLIHKRAYNGETHDAIMLSLSVYSVATLCKPIEQGMNMAVPASSGFAAVLLSDWDMDVAKMVGKLSTKATRSKLVWAFAQAGALEDIDAKWGAADL